MAFVSLTETTKATSNQRGGRSQRRSNDAALIGVCRAPSGSSNRHALSITLYPTVIKRARFQQGDRVDILFDADDGLCMVRRNNQGAWSLSSNNRKKGKASKTLRLQATLRPGMPYFGFNDSMPSQEAEWDIDEEDGGLLIQLPRHPKANGGPTGW